MTSSVFLDVRVWLAVNHPAGGVRGSRAAQAGGFRSGAGGEGEGGGAAGVGATS